MKVFRVSIKFEQNGRWSDREADSEGYIVKPSDDDNQIEGYVKMLYPTNSDPVRYIKGLYSNGSIVFMQLCNDSDLSPICYCFPYIEEQGFWSDFHETFGFFPLGCSPFGCARGHATVSLEEITDETSKDIEQETLAIFEEKSRKANKMNCDLMEGVRSLTDFLDECYVFKMKIHCGKW